MFDLVIRGERVVTPHGVGPWEIAIKGSGIAALGAPGTLASQAARVIDAGRGVVMPGGIDTFCLRREKPLHAVTLGLFLQVIAEHCGARLLRLKGLVDVVESPGCPAVIHGVQHVFHPPSWLDAWPDADRSTRIVVISQGLEARWLQDLLEVLDEEVKACSIS